MPRSSEGFRGERTKATTAVIEPAIIDFSRTARVGIRGDRIYNERFEPDPTSTNVAQGKVFRLQLGRARHG